MPHKVDVIEEEPEEEPPQVEVADPEKVQTTSFYYSEIVQRLKEMLAVSNELQ